MQDVKRSTEIRGLASGASGSQIAPLRQSSEKHDVNIKDGRCVRDYREYNFGEIDIECFNEIYQKKEDF